VTDATTPDQADERPAAPRVVREGASFRFEIDAEPARVRQVGRHVEYERYEHWLRLQELKTPPERIDAVAELTGEKVRSFYAFAGLEAGWRVLDVGFRTARNLLELRASSVEAVGLEVNRVCVEHAARLGAVAHLGDVQRGTGFADGEFDAVLMCDVLEHLFAPGSAVRECRRLLRPGGRLVLELPLEGEFGENLLDGHASLFERSEAVDRLLHSHGFVVERRAEYGDRHGHHKYRVRASRS
jgi:SAM-dependent methyltransferase